MYSESEIDNAVTAGVMSPQAAAAFRAFIAQSRHSPIADEENFRLLTGFNDIFVTIAVVLMLFAVGNIGAWIGGYDSPGAAFGAGLGVAVTSWALAEFFTRKRRMALPSIILLLSFVGGVAATLGGLLAQGTVAIFGPHPDEDMMATIATFSVITLCCITAYAAWLHWRRFRVPITVAAGTAVVAGGVMALALYLLNLINPEMFDDFDPTQSTFFALVLLAIGLCVFAFAMRWDMSDRARQTRRSDVAFWLHLLAAPLIVHPLFQLMGITNGNAVGAGSAIAAVLIYVALGLVAIAIDRRALLVSALIYVLSALYYLFREFGAVELNIALAGLVIGSALLSLSAFWTTIRRAVVDKLPEDVQEKLPVTYRTFASA